MQLVAKPISELTLDPENVREHTERSIRGVAGSLKEYGQQKPIVISSDGVVVAGNGTVMAAKRLGWEQIDAVVSHLSAEQWHQYAVVDNRTAELSRWEKRKLKRWIEKREADGLNGNYFNRKEQLELDIAIEIEQGGKTPNGNLKREFISSHEKPKQRCPHCNQRMSMAALKFVRKMEAQHG